MLHDGELVNRGTLLGPWLPIYGVGGLLSVLLLSDLPHSRFGVFALGAMVSTAIEFATREVSAGGLRPALVDYSGIR